MNVSGSLRTPRSTRLDQNCRLSWNCSLIETALLTSTLPSAASGV